MSRTAAVRLMTLLIILASSTGASWAGLSISPALVEISLDKGRPAGQFVIANLGGEEERYRIKAMHFTLARDGSVSRIPPDDHSLAQWIKFNPTEFTIPANAKRAVRFVITPPGNLRPGAYWGAMELESLKPSMGVGKDESGREYQIEIIPSILVPIVGTVGNVRYQGNLKEAKFLLQGQTPFLAVVLGNSGDGLLRLEGKYEIRDSAGNEIEKNVLPRAVVFPGSEQMVGAELKANLPEGMYTIALEFLCPQLQQPITNKVQVLLRRSE